METNTAIGNPHQQIKCYQENTLSALHAGSSAIPLQKVVFDRLRSEGSGGGRRRQVVNGGMVGGKKDRENERRGKHSMSRMRERGRERDR